MNCPSAHWTVTASEEVLQNTSTPIDTRGYRDIFLQEYPQPEVLTIKIGQGLRDVKGATNMHRANDYYSNAGFWSNESRRTSHNG